MMLPLLIEFGWKSALIAGAALIADRALRGRPAAERVFVLRAAVLALLALPIAVVALPAIELPWLAAPEVGAASVPMNAAQPAAVAPQPPVSMGIDLAALVYAIGAGAVMLHLAMGVAILVRWTHRSAPVGDARWQATLARASRRMRRPVRLRLSHDIVTPISWGLAPAWVLIDPATLERTAQAEAVIAHEAAHIRRFDWPMLVAARIAAALFWFNPLVWLLSRTLARRGETAADEAAVQGIERADYAEALLTFATAPATRAAATGMALWPNALAERIAHIAVHRPRRGSRLVPVAAMACAAAAVPLAAARLVHATPDRATANGAVAEGAAPQRASEQTATVPDAANAAALGRAAVSNSQSNTGDSPVAATPAIVEAASARPETPVIEPVMATNPMPMPQPAPQIVANPQIDPQLRIVGRGGAEVRRGLNGTTIIGGPPEPPVPMAAPVPAAIPASEVPDWARHAADELTKAASEMREGARDVELTAELPGVSAGERAKIRANARKMRADADKFEASARALRQPGG